MKQRIYALIATLVALSLGDNVSYAQSGDLSVERYKRFAKTDVYSYEFSNVEANALVFQGIYSNIPKIVERTVFGMGMLAAMVELASWNDVVRVPPTRRFQDVPGLKKWL